jgi:hypothetical protein
MSTTEKLIDRDWASSWMRTGAYWGPGILVMVVTDPLGGWTRAIGWTTGLTWLGSLCLLNFARCRRVHCAFTGPYFLVLAMVSALAGLNALTFGGNGWNLLGLAALVGGVGLTYAPEMIWGHYWRAGERACADQQRESSEGVV